MKLKGKNIKATRKATAILSIILLSGGLYSCASDDPAIKEPIETSVSANKENSNMDYVLSMDAEENDEGTLENLSTLEEQVNIYKLLDDLDLGDDYKELAQESKEELQELSLEDIKLLVESLDSDNLTEIERARVEQNLSYLKTYTAEKIDKDGRKIVLDGLFRSVKGAACEYVGLEVEYFSSVTILGQKSDSADLLLSVSDPISGKVVDVKVDNHSIYGDMIYKIYDMQSESNPSFDDTMKDVSESLDLIKISCYSGVKAKKTILGNELMTSEVKEKDIIEKGKSK